MALFDPSALPRMRVVTRTRSFTTELLPGRTMDLTFEVRAGGAFRTLVYEKQQEAFENFVQGEEKVFDGDGEVVPVSTNLALNAGFLVAIDKTQPAKGEEKYDIPRWVSLCERDEKLFNEIVNFGDEVYKEACGANYTQGSIENEVKNG